MKTSFSAASVIVWKKERKKKPNDYISNEYVIKNSENSDMTEEENKNCSQLLHLFV